jgi:hypothetical protein
MQHATVHRRSTNTRVIYPRTTVTPAARYVTGFHAVQAQQSPWRRAGLALLHRPLLALTLAVAGIFLFSAASEAIAAQRLAAQVQDARQTNITLQWQLTRTAEEIRDRTNPAAIKAAAQKLGWVVGTPTAAP